MPLPEHMRLHQTWDYGNLEVRVKAVAWASRFLLVVLLVSLLSFPAPSAGQTYGSGEIEYGGVRLQFSGQLTTTAGTCQQVSSNLVQCRLPQGAQGVLQLTATRTPAGAVNIRAEAIPAGWPAFPVASGWGTVTRQYSFTVPSGSAGQRFELRFKAWTAGVVGEIELRLIIDAIAQTTPTPPPTPPPYPPTEPVPSKPKVPRIEAVPDRLDFGVVTAGQTASALLRIANVGDGVLDVYSIGTRVPGTGIVSPWSPFRLTLPHWGPFSLSPGNATSLLVTFSPDEAGSFTEELLITSNDPQRQQVVVPLTGKAVAGPEVTRPPEETPPPGEGEVVPRKEEVKRCPECELGVLTQNCQLIPRGTVSLGLFTLTLYGGSPFAAQRAPEIGKLVGGEWAGKYQVICLQEVFSYAGKDFAYKNAVARGWLGAGDVDLGKEGWHKLEKDGKHQDQEIEVDGEKVQLLARNPGEKNNIQQIAVLKKGDRYLVTGPDSPGGGKFTVDGGLMILSKYPIIAASGFTFSDQAGVAEEFSNKGALYARIQLSPDRPELNCYVHVFNTHLAAGNARKQRQTQLNELREFIKKCTEDPQNKGEPDGNPVIICGDFNIIGGSEEYKSLKDTLKVVDAWRKAKGDTEDHTSATWVGNQKLKEEVPWGNKNVLATEGGKYQRLDYILYQIFQPEAKQPPLTLVLESIAREPAQRRAEKYPWGGYTVSDHLGVGAQFKITPAEASK